MPQTQTRAPPQCVNLDKLEAAPSEAALVARAMELLAERRFWAGVVVLGPADAADPADPAHFLEPGHVRIKIRMDIDDVTRTNKIRDRWGGRGGGRVGRSPGISPIEAQDRRRLGFLTPIGVRGGRA